MISLLLMIGGIILLLYGSSTNDYGTAILGAFLLGLGVGIIFVEVD